MSSTTAHKGPLVLLLVVVLGVGGRLWRERSTEIAAASHAIGGTSAVDSQLARVDAKAKEHSGKTRTERRSAKARGSSRAKTGKGNSEPADEAAQPPAERIREETTPLGALPIELLSKGARRREARSVRERGASPQDRSAGGRAADHAPPPAAVIDIDRASAAELEVLPRIGPSLARRIVADRAEHGPFGSLSALERVRGVGPALTRQLQGRVTFGTAGRP